MPTYASAVASLPRAAKPVKPAVPKPAAPAPAPEEAEPTRPAAAEQPAAPEAAPATPEAAPAQQPVPAAAASATAPAPAISPAAPAAPPSAKPGFFGRLFTRKPANAAAPQPSSPNVPSSAAPAATPAKSAAPTAGTAPARGEPQPNTPEWHAQDYAKNGTRAQAFKAWFGDYEKAPHAASKVVNPETGEPQPTYEIPPEAVTTPEPGASKVVGPTGAPRQVFHGTPRGPFHTFDKSQIANAEHQLFGPGFYFTEDPKAAEVFAKGGQSSSAQGNNPTVMSYYLKAHRPFDVDSHHIDPRQLPPLDRASVRAAYVQKILAEDGRSAALEAGQEFDAGKVGMRYRELTSDRGVGGYGASKQAVQELLQKQGYDAMTVQADDVGEPGANRYWIVFNNNQMKSVHNRGTFDPHEPHVLKALDTLPAPQAIALAARLTGVVGIRTRAQARAAYLKGFDSNEPRDASGRWTKSGRAASVMNGLPGADDPISLGDRARDNIGQPYQDRSNALDPETAPYAEEWIKSAAKHAVKYNKLKRSEQLWTTSFGANHIIVSPQTPQIEAFLRESLGRTPYPYRSGWQITAEEAHWLGLKYGTDVDESAARTTIDEMVKIAKQRAKTNHASHLPAVQKSADRYMKLLEAVAFEKARGHKPHPLQGSLWDEDEHPRETEAHDDKRAGEFAPKTESHHAEAGTPLRTEPVEDDTMKPKNATHAAKLLDDIRNDLPNTDDAESLLPRVDAVGEWLAAQKMTPLVRKLQTEAHQLADKVRGGSGKSGVHLDVAAPQESAKSVDVADIYDRAGTTAKHSEINAALRAVGAMPKADAKAILKRIGFTSTGDPRKQLAMLIQDRKGMQLRGLQSGAAGPTEDAKRARAYREKFTDESLLSVEEAFKSAPKSSNTANATAYNQVEGAKFAPEPPKPAEVKSVEPEAKTPATMDDRLKLLDELGASSNPAAAYFAALAKKVREKAEDKREAELKFMARYYRRDATPERAAALLAQYHALGIPVPPSREQLDAASAQVRAAKLTTEWDGNRETLYIKTKNPSTGNTVLTPLTDLSEAAVKAAIKKHKDKVRGRDTATRTQMRVEREDS